MSRSQPTILASVTPFQKVLIWFNLILGVVYAVITLTQLMRP